MSQISISFGSEMNYLYLNAVSIRKIIHCSQSTTVVVTLIILFSTLNDTIENSPHDKMRNLYQIVAVTISIL